MTLKRLRTVVSIGMLAIAGCCGPYKDAVRTNSNNLAETSKVFYQECVAKTCGGLTPEIVQAHIRKDAALACVVDTDDGKSNATTKTPACSCSEGVAFDSCKGWLGVQ